MRKFSGILAAALVSAFFVTPVPAVMIGDLVPNKLVIDVDIAGNPMTDKNEDYWSGSDTNWATNLKNSNPITEEAWLNGLLGNSCDDSSLIYLSKTEFSSQWLNGENIQAEGFNPGIEWDYAIVKFGKKWLAYEDTLDDDLLVTGLLGKDISHITFFREETANNAVPEPSTIVKLMIPAGSVWHWALSRCTLSLPQ